MNENEAQFYRIQAAPTLDLEKGELLRPLLGEQLHQTTSERGKLSEQQLKDDHLPPQSHPLLYSINADPVVDDTDESRKSHAHEDEGDTDIIEEGVRDEQLSKKPVKTLQVKPQPFETILIAR